jgi:predicted phosphodiesterase
MKFSTVITSWILIAASLTSCIGIKHGPYLQNLSADEATVVWTTNRKALSWVELTPDAGGQVQPEVFFASKDGIKTEGRVHAVRLSGLVSGTKYRYRIYSKRELGRLAIFRWYGRQAASPEVRSFVTFDPAKDSVTFTMVNDIHGRSEVLEQMLKLSEPATNDLFFFNGDMVEWMKSERNMFGSFMDASVRIFASDKPMFYARGNHETRGAGLASRFHDYFSPSTPNLYYLVRQGPVCFVVLDSGEDKPDSHKEYHGIADYSRYRSQQADWLQQALKNEMFTGAAFKVAVCHIPPNGAEAEIRNKFVPLLNGAGVDLMLCGHLHRYIRQEATPEINFPVLVNSNTTFVKATATGETLTLNVVGLDGQVVDNIIINNTNP